MDIVAGVVLLVVIGIGLYLLYQHQLGNPRATAKRFEAQAPIEVAAVTGPGTYRVSGTARPIGHAPRSPVSGRPYVALDVLVQASSDGVSRRTHRRAVDFLLDDGTGVVLVRAADLEIAVEHDHESPQTSLDQVPFADQVLRAGGVSIGSPSTCRVRMFEGVIEPGARVGILGHVEPADAHARALGATMTACAADGVALLVRAEPPIT